MKSFTRTIENPKNTYDVGNEKKIGKGGGGGIWNLLHILRFAIAFGSTAKAEQFGLTKASNYVPADS